MSDLSPAACTLAVDMSSQELTMLLWSCMNTNAVPDRRLLGSIASGAVERLQEFLPQGLAYFAWAYGRSGFAPERLYGAIAQECLRAERMNEFNGHSLARLASGFSKAGQVRV